jgi:hypothetical protein
VKVFAAFEELIPMNLNSTIIPKSDQLNADDLIAGPRTIKVIAVESGTEEQPVGIRYEGDAGRPYKPGKSMRRVLVQLWGSEGAAYVGRRLTLYRDPSITFGPDTTGGIRISHASDIAEAVELALTVKRGKRKPFRVEPLEQEKPQAAFDLQSLYDVGESKARQGSAALREWWLSLSPVAKPLLKPKLDSTWKQLAADADAQPKEAA